MSSPVQSTQIEENTEQMGINEENLNAINISDEIVKMRMKLDKIEY